MALSSDALRCLKFALGRKGVSDEIASILNGTVTNAQTFSGGATFTTSGITVTDVDVALSATTGTKLGTATTQKLGFWNATPVIQQASASQAAVTTTAATQSTPWGFASQAQADAIVTLVNRLRLDLVTTGIIKGSA